MLTGDLFQPLTEKKKKPKPTKPDKWAYAKAEAKKKFDVYPSAYANAWAAKKYKELGGGWRMGEDIDEADQQSDAPSKTYGNQKLVNIMRKAAEVPGTGLSNDQRMFVAMYDELEDAVEKIGDVEKQNQELRQQVAKQAQPAAKAAAPAKEPTAAQVKAQPAAEPVVQQVVQNITQVLQRAEQSAETPEQQKELAAAKERIADLEDKMEQLSNSDVKEIERTFVAIEKGGIKMGDVKRLLRTVDKRIEQSAKEKAAQQQTLDLLKQQPQKDIKVDQPRPQELPPAVVSALGDFNTALAQQEKENERQDEKDKELEKAIQDTNNVIVAKFGNVPQITRQQQPAANVPQMKIAAESIQEQEEPETFDFRLPAARVVGIVDDFFATNWNNAFEYFKKTYYDEENEEEEDPWAEGLSQLETAFYTPLRIIEKLKVLTTSVKDLEDYHSQIFGHQEYRSMFGQVMFPAFKGQIYKKQVKAPETKQDFDNDYEFLETYTKLIANAIKQKIHPFMLNVDKFVNAEYAENQQDNHAMATWFKRNIIQPYKAQLDLLSSELRKIKTINQKMVTVLQPPSDTQQSLIERKKKKKKSKSKKAFGGYYYPGYGYYGQGTAEISDGGGDGGGGESMFEVVTKNRTPEETGSLDSYYGRRRQPHKVEDGKRVELTDKEEIQQYLDAYENQTDRKDYGDLDETRLYFRTVATLAESLEHDFGMRQDEQGWYLTPRSGRQRILDAERAFGEPRIL